MQIIYWTVVLGWKILVACAYLIYYFVVAVGLTAVAFWKIIVGLCRLVSGSPKVSVSSTPQKSVQSPAEAVRGTVVVVVGQPPRDAVSTEPEDAKPAVMPKADPRYKE